MQKNILESLGWHKLTVDSIVNTIHGKARITHIGKKSLYLKFDQVTQLKINDTLDINNIRLQVKNISNQKIKLKAISYA